RRARRAGRKDGPRAAASRLQEERLAVRAVDGRVAARAVAVARLHVARRRRGGTLVAELGDLLVEQQMAVRAAVWLVAASAALEREPDVLEDERALDLAVAAEARPLIGVAQQRSFGRAVWLVAVDARHHAFRNLVMLGQREGRAH